MLDVERNRRGRTRLHLRRIRLDVRARRYRHGEHTGTDDCHGRRDTSDEAPITHPMYPLCLVPTFTFSLTRSLAVRSRHPGYRHAVGHHDEPTGVHQGARRVLVVALVLNAALLGVELVAGLTFGSLALVADAVHQGSDVAALGIASGGADPRDAARFGTPYLRLAASRGARRASERRAAGRGRGLGLHRGRAALRDAGDRRRWRRGHRRDRLRSRSTCSARCCSRACTGTI